MLELHRGQGMDIYWRDSVRCPSEDDYKQMVLRSTSFMRARHVTSVCLQRPAACLRWQCGSCSCTVTTRGMMG